MANESQETLDAYLGYFESGEKMEDVWFKNNGSWMRIHQPMDDEEEDDTTYDIIFDQVDQIKLQKLLSFMTP